MSRRQPTIELMGEVVAHDEIVEIIELQPAPPESQTGATNAVRLVNGSILPLSRHEINGVIEFLDRYEH